MVDTKTNNYAALSRYAVYLINFCDDVTFSNAEQSIRDLFEPICKMLEVLSGLSGLPLANAAAPKSSGQFPDMTGAAQTSELLQLVMGNVSFMCEALGGFSFSFKTKTTADSARIYSSGSEVLVFAAASCYLQYQLENAIVKNTSA